MVDLNGPWRWVEMPPGSEVMRDGTHFIRDKDDLVIAKTWGAERARAIAELPDVLAKLEAIRDKAGGVNGMRVEGETEAIKALLALLDEINAPPRAQPKPADYLDVTP